MKVRFLTLRSRLVGPCICFCLSMLLSAITAYSEQTQAPNGQQLELEGLAYTVPGDLKPMSQAARRQIRGMLNRQLQEIGSTDVSVVAVDVLLKLPAFRVMIAKEHFDEAPTPERLIRERRQFFTEAQARGMVHSYGTLKATTVHGRPAVEFQDVDKGAQGFSSSLRILCGVDTWTFTFTGSTRGTYAQHRAHIDHILQSAKVLQHC